MTVRPLIAICLLVLALAAPAAAQDGTAEPAEQLFNNYGNKGNTELLFTYGFAVKDNPLDAVDRMLDLAENGVESSEGRRPLGPGEAAIPVFDDSALVGIQRAGQFLASYTPYESPTVPFSGGCLSRI